MINFKYINFERIKGLRKYVLDKVGSKKFTGYASIDRPWEKGFTKIFANPKIPDMSFNEFFARRSEFHSCDDAMLCHERVISKKELEQKVNEYATAFVSMGVKKGDIVPICLPPFAESVIMFRALNTIGAVATNLHSTSSIESIKNYLNKFNSNLIITTNQNAKLLNEDQTRKKDLKTIYVPFEDAFKTDKKLSNETKEYIEKHDCEMENNANLISLQSFEERGKHNTITNWPKMASSDPAIILFTSGTSGEQKPIVLTNKNLIAEMIYLKNTTHMQLGPKGVALQTVSFGYPYGFVISTLFAMYVGKTVGLTPMLNQYNTDFYINMYKPMYIQAMPLFYSNLMAQNVDLSSVKYAVTGGSKMTDAVKRDFNKYAKEHGSTAKIRDGIGAGEVVACATTSVGGKYVLESVGRPLIGTNVKIVSEETGEEVKYGETGILCFSGENVMQEYFDLEKETMEAKKTDSNGRPWIYTDTYAKMDEKGYIYVLGRKARCFITYDSEGSSYKVYCDQVQSVIGQFEGIKDCVVVQCEMDRNVVPVAYIILENPNLDIEQYKNKIIEYCNNSGLDKCAVPVRYEFVENFPIHESGKPNYAELEERAANINKTV